MSREELKDIIRRVINQIQTEREQGESDTPRPACIYSDQPCDVTSYYGMNEEG